MLFQMLWGQHDEEHLHVLLKHTAQLRELHQKQSIDEETQTYREWLTKAAQKGCRGLYRTLKKDELAYLRPFQDQPRQERMASRQKQWGAIWGIRDEPLHLPQLQELIRQGAEFGQNMPPLHPKQIWHTIKHLSLKAPGLDGIGFDFLKALPYQAMQDIAQVFHQIEAQAVIPQQWTTSLIALLPKSAEIERPIALVATLYRLWCRLRSSFTKQWQTTLAEDYPWERATPGTECLQVALRRAFLTEHHNAMKRTVVSVLLDMSNFYDRIKLEALCNRWLDSNYPPTRAAFAMQLYLGGRILEAEGEASNQLWTENGILAGDPQAPLAAKVYLYNALKAVDRDPANAVRIAIQAYEYTKKLLEDDNLKISEKKTGFIASNSTAKRLLQQQLPGNGPRVHDVMRDLGVDCTAGRLRRIQTMRNRRSKASRKTKKLASLKIPQRSIRLKLYKGSIVAGISWGHEAMGLAPQVRRKLKNTMGRQLGLQRTGNIDILCDMQGRHQDPDYGSFMAQVRTYRRFYGNWPEATHKCLERAWQAIREKLNQAQYPWQVVKAQLQHYNATCWKGSGIAHTMESGLSQDTMATGTSAWTWQRIGSHSVKNSKEQNDGNALRTTRDRTWRTSRTPLTGGHGDS